MKTFDTTFCTIGFLFSDQPTPQVLTPVAVSWLQAVLVILLINPATLRRQLSYRLSAISYQLSEYLAPDRLFLRLALWLVPLRPVCGVG
jgi:hypothetical protein